MALASFNRTSFKKQKPSNSPVVFKFSVHLQECSFHPFRTYTTFIQTLAFKFLYRRFKKMRQTFVHTAEVIPVLLHTSSALSFPPFAQSRSRLAPTGKISLRLLSFTFIHNLSTINQIP